MHVDSGDLQRLLHGELPRALESEVRAHLDACATCREEMATAENEEAELKALLARVDHPPPRVEPASLMARGGGDRIPWMRWAAGFLLGMGVSGVVYAAPGSPVPGWISTFAEQISEPQTVPAEGVRAPDGAASDGGGIRVDPGDRLIIDLSGVVEGSQAKIILSGVARVEASTSSGTPSFTLNPGQLAIDGLGPDTIQITIPLSAPYVQIRADQRMAVVKDGESLRTAGGDLTGLGPFLIPLFPELP